MNAKSLSKVDIEIKKFIKRAKAVQIRANKDDYCFYGCKETGALKRQSFELSNALIALRKPGCADD